MWRGLCPVSDSDVHFDVPLGLRAGLRKHQLGSAEQAAETQGGGNVLHVFAAWFDGPRLRSLILGAIATPRRSLDAMVLLDAVSLHKICRGHNATSERVVGI